MRETLYSTGMRRSELAHLSIYDVDPEHGIVVIRQGKGKKDRVVPIGDRGLPWLQRYLDEGWPSLVREPDDGFMFLDDPEIARYGPIHERLEWTADSPPAADRAWGWMDPEEFRAWLSFVEHRRSGDPEK